MEGKFIYEVLQRKNNRLWVVHKYFSSEEAAQETIDKLKEMNENFPDPMHGEALRDTLEFKIVKIRIYDKCKI